MAFPEGWGDMFYATPGSDFHHNCVQQDPVSNSGLTRREFLKLAAGSLAAGIPGSLLLDSLASRNYDPTATGEYRNGSPRPTSP